MCLIEYASRLESINDKIQSVEESLEKTVKWTLENQKWLEE